VGASWWVASSPPCGLGLLLRLFLASEASGGGEGWGRASVVDGSGVVDAGRKSSHMPVNSWRRRRYVSLSELGACLMAS
jgi:hypothetical protein